MPNKMPTKKEQLKVKRWFKEWQKRLFLTHWTIEFFFSLQSDPTDGEDITLISCYPDITYNRLIVTVWQDFWGEEEAKQLEVCIHELVHCATAHLGDLAARSVRRGKAIKRDVDNAEEQLTQWMTNVIRSLTSSH